MPVTPTQRCEDPEPSLTHDCGLHTREESIAAKSRACGDDGGGVEQERQVVARNRKVVLGGYIERAPREDDMEPAPSSCASPRAPVAPRCW